jgi:signal transduction histidine kinase
MSQSPSVPLKSFPQVGTEIRVPVGSDAALQTECFAGQYQESLRGYLEDAEETHRSSAYDLGRRALADGLGVPDVAAAHSAALRGLLHARKGRPVSDSVIRTADGFFAECLSPFDEGSRAWRRLNQALENEAKRIAHALHDEARQLLASVHFAIADLAAELPPHRQARVQEVKWLLRRIESELRDLSHELRPTVLDHLGLKPALQFLAENVTRRACIPISVGGNDPGRMAPVVEITLYRIAQEALNNIVRHAQASSASIELQAAPERISCTVRDSGIGFAADRLQGVHELGLLIIRERLDALDGRLTLTSTPGCGTTLRAEIPRRY